MEAILSQEVQAGLDAARMRSLRQASRLRVHIGDQILPVLELQKTGFWVAANDAPNLRGFVDIYDGARHLFHCLVVASEEADGEVLFRFKRATMAGNGPALDFERQNHVPVALLGHS